MAAKKDVKKSMFWADQIARKIVSERGEKRRYVCAAGITPSGTIHIGNFREIITVDLVARALRDLGKNVRFIYSWDDYDRLRKIPANIPDRKKLEKFLMKPIVIAPDPWRCHGSYAEHFEKEVEEILPELGIRPEFIRQNKMYNRCAYSKEIKTALDKKEIITSVLNKYRKDPLPLGWLPLRIYCEKCGYETTKPENWDGGFVVSYSCRCGYKGELDFRKKGLVKLPWRVDWPMRWFYERVDFEPGGKEHSTPGGSRTVGIEISKGVYGHEPPIYQMYDFIILKSGGKMSSSAGKLFSIREIADIYIPEVMRFMFAGTKPKREFAIPTDEEIFKVYEDFYETERVYYGKDSADKKEMVQKSRIYELSSVDRPGRTIPVQVNFKHAVTLINIYRDVGKALAKVRASENLSKADIDRYRNILERAKNWIERFAPEMYKFDLQERPKVRLAEKERIAVLELAWVLESKRKLDEEELFNTFYKIAEKTGVGNREFFRAVYRVLIAREQGPRLAPFILAIGRERVAKILKQMK